MTTTPPSESAPSLSGVLVVDKARGPTSHDVVGIARRVLGTKAIGHTGTLDPMATGVLVLVVGEATKLVTSLGASSKAYDATLRLGRSTRTLDAEGEVDGEAPVPPFTDGDVARAAAAFLGHSEQRAPIVSALKVDGQSLHRRARRGEAIEAPVRTVRLDAIAVQAVRADEVDLSLACGPGFYVRSLARDLAERLGTLGHLSALRRTRNGVFTLEGAVDFEALRRAREDEALRAAIRAQVVPLATVCRGLAHCALAADGVQHARAGRLIPQASVDRETTVGERLIAFDEAGVPVAIVEGLAEGGLRVMRGFRPD